MHAHSILVAQYSEQLHRICVHPENVTDFTGSEVILQSSARRLFPVIKDDSGSLKAGSDDFQFYFDPLTGNFHIKSSWSDSLEGQFSTGKFTRPFLQFGIQESREIYGLGASHPGPHRNQIQFRMLNQDTLLYSLEQSTYSTFPFFLLTDGKKSMGVLVHTTLPALVTTRNRTDSWVEKNIRFDFEAPDHPIPMDFFIFQGDVKTILTSLATLTGKPVLPPAWALGYHQSRWSYKSSERVLEVAQKFRELDVPCDAIYLDIHYMDHYRVFTFHPEHFPDPLQMNAKLDELGMRSVAIVDPGVSVHEGYSVYEEGLKYDYFCKTSGGDVFEGKVWPGKTVFPDFTRERVRHWWADNHANLFQNGISGIWNDMNEPVLFAGSRKDPLELDVVHDEGRSHREIRNLYANLEAKSTFQAYERFKPGERPFILTRAGHTGIQRYAFLWTGDNHSTWEHLRANLHMVINLGLSGHPFTGADVGGFARGPGATGMIKPGVNRELFVRWMELGSLMPFFRNHTVKNSGDQEPWAFSEPFFLAARKQIRRRYLLFPYLYLLAHEASQNGTPLVRPVFFEFPEEIHSLHQENFFLGPSLMVAPVLYPDLYTRTVRFPPGRWVEFETGEAFEGNTTVDLPTQKKGYYPMFVREGSVLPLSSHVGRNAADSLQAMPVFEVYPGKELSGEYILDDLTTIPDGDHSGKLHLRFSGSLEEKGGRLFIERVQGGFLSQFSKIGIRLPEAYRIQKVDDRAFFGDFAILDGIAGEERAVRMVEYRIDQDVRELVFVPASNGSFGGS